jgi:hypothetical protein
MLAVLARLPVPKRVNRYSDVSLGAYIAFVVKLRGALLLCAGLLFAIALVVASLSPLFS